MKITKDEANKVKVIQNNVVTRQKTFIKSMKMASNNLEFYDALWSFSSAAVIILFEWNSDWKGTTTNKWNRGSEMSYIHYKWISGKRRKQKHHIISK